MTLEGYTQIAKSPDPASSQELMLYIENDADLYRQQHTPIIQNLVAKKARGVYKSDLAAKLFGYLVESGAKKYYAEVVEGQRTNGAFGFRPNPAWSRMFPKKVRDAVAAEFRDSFETEYELGNYDQYVPKKYQAKKVTYKATSKKTKSRKSAGVTASLGGMR